MATIIRGQPTSVTIREGETVSFCCDGVPGQPFTVHAPDCRYAERVEEATVDPTDPNALLEAS